MALISHHIYQNLYFLQFFLVQKVPKLASCQVRKSIPVVHKVIMVWRYELKELRLFVVFQYIDLYYFYQFYI